MYISVYTYYISDLLLYENSLSIVPRDSPDLSCILHYIMIFVLITFLLLTLLFLPDYYVIAFYPAIIYVNVDTSLKPNTTIKCTSHLDQAQLLYRLTDSLMYTRAKRLMRVHFLSLCY